MQSLWSALGSIARTGGIVSDAIHSYALMQIQLFDGMVLPPECQYAGGMADYEQDEAALYIAADRALNSSTEALEIGAGNVCKDFRSVVAHEIGHLVMPFAEEALGEKFAITYDMYPKSYWEKNVSKYAGTSDHELFGEAFAAYTHPEYGKNEQVIPAVLEAIFVKVGISVLDKLVKISKEQRSKSKKTRSQTAVDIITDDGTLIVATKINDIVESVGDADWFELEGDISPALLSAFKDAGYTELAGTSSAGDETLFNAVNRGAEEYAEEHSADLVTGLEDSTRDMLRGTIEDAVKEGWGQDELAEEIANNYGFSETRADTIARNELSQAYSRGRIDAAEGAGATQKRSLLSADHDDKEDCDCSDAADAGAVDFDESFTDDPDYDFPPYHVNCQCDWVGVYPGDEDSDDEEIDLGDDEEGGDEEHGKFAKGGPGSGPHPGNRHDDRDKVQRLSHDARNESRKTKDTDAKEATNYAHDSTHVTSMIDSSRLHTTAAKDHTEAAKAHEKIGNEKVAAIHREIAEIHTHLAETKTSKFAKRILDNDPEDYVEQELSQKETDENNYCMELSGIALKLSSPEDIDGQRISGKADARTRVAVMNYDVVTGSRSSDHRTAYEFHTEAALHYKQQGNDKSQKAHQYAADAHKKIADNLAVQALKSNSIPNAAKNIGGPLDLPIGIRLTVDGEDKDLSIIKISIDDKAHEAATSPWNNLDEPSDEQKHAGNYKMGHINVGGIQISIENTVGSRRRAGWTTLKAHYGYISFTEGADGDHIDVFVREGTDDKYNGPVYVIDQYIDGKFDEHKVMIGWQSKQKACAAYLGSYQAGWKLGPVTKLSWKVFKEWVDEETHVEPIKTNSMV